MCLKEKCEGRKKEIILGFFPFLFFLKITESDRGKDIEKSSGGKKIKRA